MRKGEHKGGLIICKGCSVEFYAAPSSHRLYCCKECHDRSKAFSDINFWRNVAVGELHECWPWQAGRDHRGEYGRAFDGFNTRQAHALALELVIGRRIKPGLLVLHSCDNPPCCNPQHLREGTVRDNTRDSIIRGRKRTPYIDYDVPMHRRPIGDRNGMRTHPESILRGEIASELRVKSRTLTRADVIEIRKARKRGVKLRILAARYGVREASISRAANYRRWAWLTNEGGRK